MKVVRAFTRPVSSFPHFPASSKSGNGGAAAMMASLDSSVLQLLREKNIVFGAAPQLKAGNPLAIMLVRTAIPFAYLYFMYRMVTKMTKGPQDGNTGSRLKPEALPQGKSGFDQVSLHTYLILLFTVFFLLLYLWLWHWLVLCCM
jgi:hypothetical protein